MGKFPFANLLVGKLSVPRFVFSRFPGGIHASPTQLIIWEWLAVVLDENAHKPKILIVGECSGLLSTINGIFHHRVPLQGH